MMNPSGMKALQFACKSKYKIQMPICKYVRLINLFFAHKTRLIDYKSKKLPVIHLIVFFAVLKRTKIK